MKVILSYWTDSLKKVSAFLMSLLSSLPVHMLTHCLLLLAFYSSSSFHLFFPSMSIHAISWHMHFYRKVISLPNLKVAMLTYTFKILSQDRKMPYFSKCTPLLKKCVSKPTRNTAVDQMFIHFP